MTCQIGFDTVLIDVSEVALFTGCHLFSPHVRVRDAALILLHDKLQRDPNLVTISVVKVCIDDILLNSQCRLQLRDDRLECGTEASLGYPDTEGWGSLETSLKALNMCFSYTSCFNIISLAVPILENLVRHTNRFAREQMQFVLHEIIRISPFPLKKDIIEFLSEGLKDNWSQVRYAAGAAVRCLVRRLVVFGDDQSQLKRIIPLLLINRHFVAEGIKRQSQDTWRILVGPAGGLKLIDYGIFGIMDQLVESIESVNHSTRESAVSCMYEILVRVIIVSGRRDMLDGSLPAILRVAISSLEDEAWSVREFGQQIVDVLYAKADVYTSETCIRLLESKAEFIAALVFRDICHPVQPIRVSASSAIAAVVKFLSRSSDVWAERLFSFVEKNIEACLCEIVDSPAVRSHFRRIPGDQCFENRPMYSCGSLVSNSEIKKLHIHSLSDDCCNSGALNTDMVSQSWELSDGCIRLYAALSRDPVFILKYPTDPNTPCAKKLLAVFQSDNYVKATEIRALILENFASTFTNIIALS